MDYPQNRQKYLAQYPKYFNNLVLNKFLIDSVKRYSGRIWDNQSPSDEAIKGYILLELTKSRESCAEVIKFLAKSEVKINEELADGLKELNTSPGRIYFGYEINIPVTPVLPTERKKANTKNYAMTRSPRGKAIIINVVPNEVKREAQRFQSVFSQLLFNSEIHFSLTTYQIKVLLKRVAEDLTDRAPDMRDEALIVMIITHGLDEKILGKNHPKCGGKDKFDIAQVTDIVDIFAKVPDTLKMFFFTCCRHMEDFERYRELPNSAKNDGTDTNTNTIIYCSSAEGYETPIEMNLFYTPFGKALSESFAQYSDSLNLAQIIEKTNQELQRTKIVPGDASKAITGYYSPESKVKSTTHSVYLNPGWYESMGV